MISQKLFKTKFNLELKALEFTAARDSFRNPHFPSKVTYSPWWKKQRVANSSSLMKPNEMQ